MSTWVLFNPAWSCVYIYTYIYIYTTLEEVTHIGELHQSVQHMKGLQEDLQVLGGFQLWEGVN